MDTLIMYVLKVNIALVVFYLLYAALLRKDTFLRMRRWYFIVIILFSLCYPLFTIDALQGKHLFDFSRNKEVQTSVEIATPMAGIVVEDEPVQTSLSLEKAVGGLAVIISLLLLARFGGQLLSILILKRKSEKKEIFDTPIYYVKEDMPPFSFFNWIFINTDVQSSDELQQILLHEKTHASQYHSIDIVLNEFLCIAFWWNPAVWLIRNEVKINLEYLADNKVLEKGADTKEYQYLLLRMTNHEAAVQIVNNFNVSQLKQRIIMMNKLKSPNIKMARYAWIIPFACMFLVVNSIYAEKKSEVSDAAEVVQTLQKKVTKKTNVTPPSTTPLRTHNTQNGKDVKEKDQVYAVVDKQPEFPGGISALMKYLGANIQYPKVAMDKGIEGRVIAQFVVEKDGKINEVKVLQGIDPALDAEAIRMVQAMPNWKPGIHKGEKVRVKYTLPINFRLKGDKKETEKDQVYAVVDKQPEFPGGISALMKYLGANIQYPKVAMDKGIEGRVIAQFVVEKDGKINEVKVLQGIDPALDAEAIRMVQAMPNWKPGEHQGKLVRVRYTLPITFKLKSGANQPKTEEK